MIEIKKIEGRVILLFYFDNNLELVAFLRHMCRCFDNNIMHSFGSRRCYGTWNI